MNTEVLIVGAGPTGLVLAAWLHRLKVAVRIIDKTAEPGTTSRALAVHARTLELYRQLGLADEVVAHGLRFAAFNMWVNGKHVARADFTDLGTGLSPFPYILIYPQDQHERMLVEHLKRAGIEVERNTELTGFEQTANGVVASVVKAGEPAQTCEAGFIVGCDGAHSKVREQLGITFAGSTYNHVFYVADVELRGPAANHELHVSLDSADLLAIFPMRGASRLIGTVRVDAEGHHEKLTWDDVNPTLVKRMELDVVRVNWFSTYRVHHRVAERFRGGRAFLAGDAAHIHSPVGGQGMNTGIGDAVNLAWKLEAVLRGKANAALLDSYEPERIAFAKQLVSTTDRAFTVATNDGFFARHVRLDGLPVIAPVLMRQKFVRRFVFRSVSQMMVSYPRSALSQGKAGAVRGGDRLPWVDPKGQGTDNFTPLASVAWQVHVYGQAPAELTAACQRLNVPLICLPWGPQPEIAGLAENAAYLVRPDGYVALADEQASGSKLERYFQAHGLKLIG